MSALPPLSEYKHFEPTNEHIEEVKQWLRRRHPKHNDRRPLTWYFAYLVLEVSEVTIREYVKRGILEDLTIPSLAVFIAKRDLVWEKYGRPDDYDDELDERIKELTDELNAWKAINGTSATKASSCEELREKMQIIKDLRMSDGIKVRKKRKELIYRLSIDFNFINAVMQGEKYADQ